MSEVNTTNDPLPISTEGRSKRYVLFHKAFELAFQRANEKWTEEDCASCFPLIHAAAPHLLQTIRQESIDEEEKKITETWGAADGIDALHKAILESRRRAAAAKDNPNDPNNAHKDTWRPTLDPHTAVRAVKVPLLRQELERLKNEIEQGTARNMKLDAEMRSNVAAQEEATRKVQTLLVGLDKVQQHSTPLS
ncbi:hypothetical protein BS47DRAFT_1290391 [Hydnum rufescens UP504]|uniref:Uncharacterized protein n=1 Tax=Hydnum rufescens UP504 TaxID=1448309 RepID=A0A9P6DXS7_9AGAM|nr:hypothetical protein BS47DRAFT_1290391 [Hydnum rufescens UP504]